MHEFLLGVYKRQVIIQSHLVITAYRELGTTIFVGDPLSAGTMGPLLPRKDIGIEHVFYCVQNMLNGAANMSKAFWGSGGKRATERNPLRDFFAVTDTSPLREVNMRNNFEHFDDRVDEWFQSTKTRHFIDMNFGPFHKMMTGIDANDFFHNYDPENHDLYFWGETFNLNRLFAEVERVRRVVET